MKKLISIIAVLIVATIFPLSIPAFESVMIQNHSFSLITEDKPPIDQNQSFLRTAIFIKNEDCNIQYKALFGEVVLGEGVTKLEVFPQIIKLGNNTLKIRCLAPENDIRVEEIE